MVVGTGGSLTVAGSGTINATTLLAATWAAPNAIGSVTPAAIAGTTIDGPLGSVTPAAIAGTTLDTSGVASILADAVTNGNGLLVSADGISGGNGILFSSSSTAGTASSSSILHQIARTGNNANNSHLAYGLYVSVANTGTTNTNVAGYFGASGASTSNVGIHVGAGVAQFDGGINLVNGDLDLADGTVIDFDAGDVTVTHSTGKLALSGSLTVSEVAAASGTPNIMTLTGASHTGLTATTEVIGVYYDLSATKTWATGAIALQREVYIQPPTYAAAAASTITAAYTMDIGRPVAGANVTLTGTESLRVDGITSPGAGANTEVFGAGASVGGSTNSTFVGSLITNSGSITNVGVGSAITFDASSNTAIAIGHGIDIRVGDDVIAIGQAIDLDGVGNSDKGVFIGRLIAVQDGGSGVGIGANQIWQADSGFTVMIGASANTGPNSAYGVGLGYGVNLSAPNQFVVGSSGGAITTAYIGEGVTSASPGVLSINATGGSGSNVNSSTLTFAGGRPTGSGSGGSVIIQTPDGIDLGASTQQALTTVATFDGSGSLGGGSIVQIEGDLNLNKAGFAALYSNGTRFLSHLNATDANNVGLGVGQSAVTGGSNVWVGGLVGASVSNVGCANNVLMGVAVFTTAGNVAAQGNTMVGHVSGQLITRAIQRSTFLGMQTGTKSDTGDDNTYIGYQAGQTTAGDQNSAFGSGSGPATDINATLSLGMGAVPSASNQMVVGSTGQPITTAYIGEGVTSASPGALLLSATGGTTGAASINASTLTIQGGLPSGAGTGGSVIIATTDGVDPGGFGAQVPTTVVTFDGSATAASTFAGGISSPGSGSSSEKFGAGAIAGGNSNTVVGAGATSVDIGAHNNTLVGAATVNFNNNSNANNTMIGFNQTNASGNASQTSVGYQTVNASSTGIIVGASSTIGASSGSTILIGFSSDIAASSAESILIGRDGLIAHTESILIAGRSGTTTANNQFVVGSASSPITTAYIGEGVTSATPGSLLLSTTGASGSDIAAGTFTIAGGTSTGSGSGGDLVFQVHDGADAAAATPNVLTTVMTMVAGVVRYPKIETQIAFAEVTEPADVGSYGQLYTTTSNDLRFKGGDGVDNQVTLHDGAKYYFAAVIAALDLTEANIDHGIDAATTEHMDGTWTFKAGTNGATGGFTITDVANDGAGDIRCTTSAAHGITAPSVVVITNTSDAVDLPNGSYYVAVVSDTTHFDLLGATYTSTTATADYIEPSQLTAGASDAGQYDIEWDLNQEASGAGSTYITKSWKCTSAGVCAAYASGTRERTTTTTTIGHYYGKSIESAVASGDKYFLTVQAGATNVDPTNKYGSLSTRRH